MYNLVFLLFWLPSVLSISILPDFRFTQIYNSPKLGYCHKFRCKLSSQNFSPDTCVYYDARNNTDWLNPCNKGYCQTFYPETNATCTSEPRTRYRFPGHKCISNLECFSQRCINGICKGAELGQDCSSTADCDPELQCKNKSCIIPAGPGEPCNGNGQCEFGYECGYNSSSPSICIPYFSHPGDSPVLVCDMEYICESGYCIFGDIGYQCANGVRSAKKVPTECESHGDCMSADGRFGGYCECGYNDRAQGYCNLFGDDSLYRNYVRKNMEWAKSGLGRMCNILTVFSSECVESYWDRQNYKEWEFYKQLAKNYPKLVNNDECVKQIYTSKFWNL